MKLLRYTLACLALSTSLAITGCGGGDTNPEPSAPADPITQDDVVDLGDLITQEADAAAAAEMIGDPATLLAEGKKQGEKARMDIAAVLGFIKDVASGAPTKSGKTPKGNAGAVWTKSINGVELAFAVERTGADRLRYVMLGKKDAATPAKGLLTGIFIKKGPKTGGGRLHANLSNLSDLFNAPGADGSVHFWFANHKNDVRGRRIAYVNVVRRDDPTMMKANYGGDLVRLVGVGGRFRSVAVSDFIPGNQGPEAVGLRILWKAGEGGRAAAAVAAGNPPMLLGTAHECWDKDGLRTAYSDDNPSNDAMNPNEGDVTMCAGFAQEQPTDPMDVSQDGMDMDPELDALLDDVGASGIAEADAEDASDIGL